MGRPRTFDEEEVLDKAVDVFWSKGYEATSLNDLLDALDISRQSLYNTYGNKHELFLKALRRYDSTSRIALLSTLSSPESDLEDLREFLLGMADRLTGCNKGKACLMVNTAAELGEKDASINTILREHHKSVRRCFLEVFRRIQQRGELKAERDPEALADMILVLILGMGISSKAGAGRSRLEKMVNEFFALIT